MEKGLYYSNFLGFSKSKNEVAVFNKLCPKPVYITKKEWIDLKNNKVSPIEEMLQKTRVVVKSKKDDQKLLLKKRKEVEKIFKNTSVLYLVLTKQCNLKCSYCLVDSNEIEKEMMDFQTAKDGIDLWFRHLHDNFNKNGQYFIIFYGGEPLLNTPTLEESLKYIKKCQKESKVLLKNLKIILPTNGILLSPKLLKLLKKYRVSVVVGLDGNKHINDYYRKDKKGRGTFLRVTKGINVLQKNKIDVSVSTTILPENIKKIKEFSKLLNQYHIKEFGFNVLKGKKISCLSSGQKRKEYYQKATEGIIENFNQTKKYQIHERQIEERINTFNEGGCIINCGGCGGQIVIQPNGDISNCPFLEGKIENIKSISNNFRIWDSPIVKKWQKRLPVYNPNCLNCEAISICGGGCPLNAKETKGSFLKKDESVCILNKRIFNFLIWGNRK